MALNTTPGPDCESLATALEADAYHESRGNSLTWAALDQSQKEVYLRQGYDYLYGMYGAQWADGVPFGQVGEAIPRLMRDACCLLALRAKNGPLMPEATAQKVESTVGPITTKYAEINGGMTGVRKFPDIDRMVGQFLAPAPSPYIATLIRN